MDKCRKRTNLECGKRMDAFQVTGCAGYVYEMKRLGEGKRALNGTVRKLRSLSRRKGKHMSVSCKLDLRTSRGTIVNQLFYESQNQEAKGKRK